jgi:hypothetical protein
MTKKFYAPDFLHQAATLVRAWSQIDMKLVIGNLTVASLSVEIEKAQALDIEISDLETTLLNKRNQRDEVYANVWDGMKRVRAAIKGIYGDNSSQYEMVGGTRMSERKSPSRKIAA